MVAVFGQEVELVGVEKGVGEGRGTSREPRRLLLLVVAA